jgi:RNA polymerase sigma-70 factor, ECF subfamily
MNGLLPLTPSQERCRAVDGNAAARSGIKSMRMRNQMLESKVTTVSTAAEDTALVASIGRHDQGAFESLMRRHNGRLFRVARAILKDDGEAEDVLQDAYLDAYRNMSRFRGDSQLGTWLVRIVVNHALMRLRRRKRDSVVVSIDDRGGRAVDGPGEFQDHVSESPTAAALRGEIRRLLERRIDELPVAFRTVFVLREVEELSGEETAECLGIPPATVRTRLFRARALLREALARDMDMITTDVFAFAGSRCDRIVAAVQHRLSSETTGTPDGPTTSNAT